MAFTSIHEQIDEILTRYQRAANESGQAIGYGDGVAHFKTIIISDTEEEARHHAENVAWAWAEWLGGYGFNEAFRLPGETGPIPNNFETTQRGHRFILYGTRTRFSASWNRSSSSTTSVNSSTGSSTELCLTTLF